MTEKFKKTQSTCIPRKVPGRGRFDEKARLERVEFLRRELELDLSELGPQSFNSDQVKNNIESLIGAVEIPFGLAGPLLYQTEEGSEWVYAPLATTEGALVASVNRGAYCVSLSGGFESVVEKNVIDRCPMFSFRSTKEANAFKAWILEQKNEFDFIISRYSNHAQLIELQPIVIGRDAHVHMIFNPQDAAGQNMSTTCTWQICQWIEQNYQGIKNFYIEANGSSDKKWSQRSVMKGRGVRVQADCFIEEKAIRKILKTTSQDIFRLFNKAQGIATHNGMAGYSVNACNVIAAIFAATGQDLACLHESGTAIMQMELDNDGLYASILLPNLVVGTVGGGTGLPAQKKMLELMNCSGGDKKQRLAAMIAGFVLSLELSTMAAIVSGQFAHSHERLGRNRPVDWLRQSEMDENFFKELSKTGGELKADEIVDVDYLKSIEVSNSIITEITSRVSQKTIGFFPFLLRTSHGDHEVVVKSKPLDQEVMTGLEVVAALGDVEVSKEFSKVKNKTIFKNSHLREMEMYRLLQKECPEIIPRYYGDIIDEEREIYLFAQEKLESHTLRLMNTENNIELWKKQDIEKIIETMSRYHSIFFDQRESFLSATSLERGTSLQHYLELRPLFRLIFQKAKENYSTWLSPSQWGVYGNIIDEIEQWAFDMEEHPHTLIHHDLNPRNLAFREGGTPVLYDWELACLHLPQRDFAEFVAFTTGLNDDQEYILTLLEKHRQMFCHRTGEKIDAQTWRRGYLYGLYDFLVQRLSFYMIGHLVTDYNFLPRVVQRTLQLIERERDDET